MDFEVQSSLEQLQHEKIAIKFVACSPNINRKVINPETNTLFSIIPLQTIVNQIPNSQKSWIGQIFRRREPHVLNMSQLSQPGKGTWQADTREKYKSQNNHTLSFRFMVGTEQGKEEKKKKMKSTFISPFNFWIGRQQQCVCWQQDQPIKNLFKSFYKQMFRQCVCLQQKGKNNSRKNCRMLQVCKDLFL